MRGERRQGVVDPGDARADLAQRVEEDEAAGRRAAEDGLRREQPADGEPDEDRALRREP